MKDFMKEIGIAHILIILMFGILLTGMFILMYGTVKDINEKDRICTDAGGEIITGSSNPGCLINDTLHDLVKTKSGWRVLDG